MKNFLKYLVIAIPLVTLVDYTTAFNPDFQKWVSFMPSVWVFYIGYAFVFSFFIYILKFDGLILFFLTLLAGAGFELLIFHNNPVLLPLIAIIYLFITFVPKWIVERKVLDNKNKVIFMTIVWILISVLNYISTSRMLNS